MSSRSNGSRWLPLLEVAVYLMNQITLNGAWVPKKSLQPNRCRGVSLCGLEHLWGTGAPSSPARERRACAEQIEVGRAGETGDFYPASELSGEIKLLLLLCVCI